MSLTNAVDDDPRFWAYIAAGGLGCLGGCGHAMEETNIDAVFDRFSVNSDAVERWSQGFTKWHPTVFDDADGSVDDPSKLSYSLLTEVDLSIQFHPGEWIYSLKSSREMATVGTLGPHWIQPGLRWMEAVAFADIARRQHSTLLPLLLPLVWLDDDDVAQAESVLEAAWGELAFVHPASAKWLAKSWTANQRSSVNCKWWETRVGVWVTNGENSTRFVGRPVSEINTLNRILNDGLGVR